MLTIPAYRRKFGAENNTNNVVISVNNVKMMRHNRSTTIAANFQSFAISLSASSDLSWFPFVVLFCVRNVEEKVCVCLFNHLIGKISFRTFFSSSVSNHLVFTWSVIQRNSFRINANSYSDEPKHFCGYWLLIRVSAMVPMLSSLSPLREKG